LEHHGLLIVGLGLLQAPPFLLHDFLVPGDGLLQGAGKSHLQLHRRGFSGLSVQAVRFHILLILLHLLFIAFDRGNLFIFGAQRATVAKHILGLEVQTVVMLHECCH